MKQNVQKEELQSWEGLGGYSPFVPIQQLKKTLRRTASGLPASGGRAGRSGVRASELEQSVQAPLKGIGQLWRYKLVNASRDACGGMHSSVFTYSS